MEKTKARNKAFSLFGMFISLLLVFLTVLTMGGLFRVFNLAAAYEKANPDRFLNEIISCVKEDNWQKLIDLSHAKLSPFENAEHVKSSFANIKKDELKAKRKKGVEFEYIITDGINTLGTVVFKEGRGEAKTPFKPLELSSFELNLKYAYGCEAELPENSVLKINGIVPEEKGVKGETVTDRSVGTSDKSPYVLKKTIYKIEGLCAKPTVTAERDKKPLLAEIKGKNFSFYGEVKGETLKKCQESAEAAAKAYANYISNDLKFDEIKGYFLPNTDTYSNLQTFYNGWYIPHDSFTFENMKISDPRELSGDFLSCDVSFNYVVTKGFRRHEYPSDYHIVIACTPHGYLVSSLTVN
ncbi:MAG: hypothetical protein RRY40_04345 [Oscillospiraceae bacterium]